MKTTLLMLIPFLVMGCTSLENKLVDATRFGTIDEVQHLLDRGVDVNSPQSLTKSGSLLPTTALNKSLSTCEIDKFKLLVSKGADLNKLLYNKQSKGFERWDGNHALHEAANGGCVSIIRYIVDELDVPVDYREQTFENTALMIAAKKLGYSSRAGSTRIETIDALLRLGADVHATNKYGENVLYFASRNSLDPHGNTELLKKFLALGVNPSVANTRGKTPLMEVASRDTDNMNSFKVLLEFGADPDMVDHEGKTYRDNLILHKKWQAEHEAQEQAAEDSRRRIAVEKRRKKEAFWDGVGALAGAVHRSSGSNSLGSSTGYTPSSNDLDRMANEARDNILEIEKNARAQKIRSNSQSVNQATQGTSSSNTSSTIHPQDLEKQNCINAGKRWKSTGGCDYSSTVKIQGWNEGRTAITHSAAADRINDSGNSSEKYSHENNQGTIVSNLQDDDCCYDIGLSDKTYGDALDKAKAKSERVCQRKGSNLVPVDLYHEEIKASGFKYKSHLTYKCGSK